MEKCVRKICILSIVITLLFGLCNISIYGLSKNSLSAPKIIATNISSSGKVKLKWNDVSRAVKYKIYYSTSKSGKYKLLKTTTDNQWTYTSAKEGKTYYFYVRAENKKGKVSTKSNIVKRTCDIARPTISLSNISSTGKIKISWKKVAGAEKYEIYRATKEKGKYSKIKSTTSTSFTNTSVKAEKKYYYKVKAIAKKSAANSAYSTEKSRVCDLSRPVIKITNLNLAGTVKISWEKISDAEKYQVYRASSKDGKYTLIKSTSASSFVDTSAKVEKVYYYKVRAVSSNSDANSAYSYKKTGKRKSEKFEITVSLNDAGKPTLVWEAVRDAIEYEVYRAALKDGKYILLNSTTKTRFTNPSASPGVKYYYKVKAILDNGKTVESELKSIKVKDPEGEILITSYINTPTATLYTAPDDNSDATILLYMTEVKVGDAVSKVSSGCWYRVFYKNRLYYTWSPTGTYKFTTDKSDFQYTGETQYQQKIIDKAMSIYNNWDTVYTNGQSDGVMNEDGTYGFDCSGFVSYVFNYELQPIVPTYRLSANITTLYETGLVYNGGLNGEYLAIEISLNDIKPGDVLFFSEQGKKVDHCGIYLGNGEFIHSCRTGDGVCIMPLEGRYTEVFITAKRFFPDEPVEANLEVTTNNGYTKLYAERNADSEVLYKFGDHEKLTLLYTSSNGNWAYVRNMQGITGFVLLKYINL